MDLTFQVPMQYCSLQHRTLLPSPVTSTTGCCFLLWLPLHSSGVISPLISSSILGTYQPGEFIFQCPIFLLFHIVYGILKAGILKWFAIPFSSGPLQYSCLENPVNTMKRQKDTTLKDELSRSVDAQYATEDQWRNNSRKNEQMESKQKQHPVV